MKLLFSLVFISFYCNVLLGQTTVMDFYKARAKDLAEPDQPGGAIKSIIVKQNIPNGFISVKHDPPLGHLIGSSQSREDMALFVAKNGVKFVAIASMDLTDFGTLGWSCEPPRFFELQNGSLVDVSEKYLPMSDKDKLLNELSSEEKSIWVKIPEFGTTILIGSIDKKMGEKSFKTAYEMQFNDQNGTFKLVKK